MANGNGQTKTVPFLAGKQQSKGTMQKYTVDKQSSAQTPVGPPDYSRPIDREEWLRGTRSPAQPRNLWMQRTVEKITPKATERARSRRRKAFVGIAPANN